MAKWFWNLIQKPGEMPAKTDLFPTVEDAGVRGVTEQGIGLGAWLG